MSLDFIRATNLIAGQNKRYIVYQDYDRVYPYTTEVISGYMPSCVNSSILTIVGSGDQYLNASLMGAKDIDVIDINKLAINYLRLKKAAVLALSKEEFYDFLTNNAKKYFLEVSKYLDSESIDFWSEYIKYFVFQTGIQGTPMFYPRHHGSDYLIMNNYMQKGKYDELRNKLHNTFTGEEFHKDIEDLYINKKYDKIFLSNVINYKPLNSHSIKMIKRLIDYNLKNNGEIYYGYFYYGHQTDMEYYLDKFPLSQIIEIDSTLFKGEKDHVLVYKKDY